jgi:hypothetical protein
MAVLLTPWIPDTIRARPVFQGVSMSYQNYFQGLPCRSTLRHVSAANFATSFHSDPNLMLLWVLKRSQCYGFLRPAGGHPLKQPYGHFSGGCSQDGWTAAIFYPLGHPTPYASEKAKMNSQSKWVINGMKLDSISRPPQAHLYSTPSGQLSLVWPDSKLTMNVFYWFYLLP